MSIQPPPTHTVDGFECTTSRAQSELSALIGASTVAALPVDGQCGNSFGGHGGELAISYFLFVSFVSGPFVRCT
jgi:hypothetical protein